MHNTRFHFFLVANINCSFLGPWYKYDQFMKIYLEYKGGYLFII